MIYKHVRFDPWVGKNYGPCSRFGCAVLVLGEAHYDDAESYCRDYTYDLVQCYLAGDFNMQFLTNLAQALIGKHHTEFERTDVYSDIAFYNYIQEFAASRARVPPGPQMWSRSESAFFEVLDVHRPNCIIVLGDRLWGELPNKGSAGPVLSVDSESLESWLYPLDNGRYALAGQIHHPSSGFSSERWHPWIQEYLTKAKSLM